MGRVMTCVLGIIVNREREIRAFVKTPFYRVIGTFRLQDKTFPGELVEFLCNPQRLIGTDLKVF